MKLSSTQCRTFLEKISSPESRRLGGLHAMHLRGKHREAIAEGCQLCAECAYVPIPRKKL